MRAKTWRRAGIAVAAGALLVAVGHAPVARPLVARLARATGLTRAGCPLGAHVEPAKLEAERARATAALAGDAPAASRPALGFALGRSTKDEVRASMEARGARCDEELAGLAVRCHEGDTGDAFFRFDTRGALSAVDAMRETADADEAATWMRDVAARLSREAGPPASQPPDAVGAYLRGGALRRASYTYRFRDYAADVSAVSMGGPRVVLREQYRAIAD
jgi:hypothetical protein